MSYYEDVNETINPGWIADAKKLMISKRILNLHRVMKLLT